VQLAARVHVDVHPHLHYLIIPHTGTGCQLSMARIPPGCALSGWTGQSRSHAALNDGRAPEIQAPGYGRIPRGRRLPQVPCLERVPGHHVGNEHLVLLCLGLHTSHLDRANAIAASDMRLRLSGAKGTRTLTPCLQRSLTHGSDMARCSSSPCSALRKRPRFTGCRHSIGHAAGTLMAVRSVDQWSMSGRCAGICIRRPASI